MLVPYIRRSRGDEEKISIEDQRRAIREWAERSGVELAPEVVERGVSGHTSWRERELGEVVARCERGDAAGVIVSYFSRLTREEDDQTWQVLTALKPHRLVCVRENIDKDPGKRVDLATAITAYQSTAEWEVLSGNLRKGKHDVWERGGWVGIPPAGYAIAEDGRLVKNRHAGAIGRALTARAGGASWSEVARILTEARVPAWKAETRWQTQATTKLAQKPLHKGVLRCTCGCGGERVVPELAVVTPSTWEAAQPSVGDPQRDPRKRGGRRDPGGYLLSGLLFCGGCGYRMVHATTTANGKRYERYRCHGGARCDAHASVSTELLEPLVTESAIEYAEFMEPTAGREASTEELARLEHERDDASRRLAAFIAAADPLDPGYADRLVELRGAIQAAEATLLEKREASVRRVTADEMRRDWETASTDVRRRFLRLVLDGVTVHRPRYRGEPLLPEGTFTAEDALAGRIPSPRLEVHYKPVVSRGWKEAS